ncbi:MAG: hypothetical protein EPO06_01360 [Burkholderiaceae bacterium]|nr:MAG: hypothetical protein EPO06_01360 [Burkholderiaceae bacterium]
MLNKFLAILALSLLSSVITPAVAQQFRRIPPNLPTVQITGISYPQVKLGDRVYRLAPGALIYSEQNSTLVSNQVTVGAVAKVWFNAQGEVQTLWILTPQERAGQ